MKELLLIFCVISTIYGQANRQIINGLTAKISNFPYMAGIYTYSVFTCGGAIINFRSVLTAAHCINSVPQEIRVSVGSARLNGQDGNMLLVSNTFLHPDYRGLEGAIISDIAVIRTATMIRFSNQVRPIPLGNNFVNTNERVIFTGWGLTGNNENSKIASNLQTLNMTIISNSVCAVQHQSTMARGWITSEKMCTVGFQNNQSAGICAGDSGGPLVSRGTVIGVASWTIRPCATFPSVFIRVSNHLRWIRDNL